MNTRNPKFWAVVGFTVGALMAAGGGLSSPADSLLGGLIQTVVWFIISSIVIRAKKFDPVASPDLDEGQNLALWKKIIGGFFFLGGIFMIFAYAFQADGASLGAALFNLVIGTPWFWPTARVWLNKIPFPQK
jgi:hypothetical protein